MSYQGLLAFNAATDSAKSTAADIQSLMEARDNHEQQMELMNIKKKQANLDVDAQSMTNQDTALNLQAKKDFINNMFNNQQKIMDGRSALIDQQEQQTAQQHQQAGAVAAHLFNTDPDVQAHVANTLAGNTPQPSAPGQPAAQSDPQSQFDNNNMSMSPAYSNANTLTVPGPDGSTVMGDGTGNAQAPSNPVAGAFGMPAQANTGGDQPQAQPAAQPQAPVQSQDAGITVSRETPDTQQTPSNLPPLSQVYQGLSTAPFGEATSDLYMKNPNVMEAIKSGNYLIKKDPQMIESANPLALNENDRTVLSDVPMLKKAGYAQGDIFNQLTPGTQSLIKTVGEYRATPAELTSSFGGGRQKQELVKAVQAFYPKWSDAVYDQRHKSLIDFTDPNGANGQAIASTRQGIEHMDELTSSIDAVSNKTIPGPFGRNVPVLNAPMNKIMQYVGGDPDILALKQNINAVTEEMTKAWGGAKAGEARLANWRDTMNATNSPQGWSGLLSKTAKLWQDAAGARESMFQLAMGGQKMQDVLGQGVLLPDQQAILDRIKGGYTPNNPNGANGQSQAGSYKAGDTRTIQGVTYTRNANGQWSSQ